MRRGAAGLTVLVLLVAGCAGSGTDEEPAPEESPTRSESTVPTQSERPTAEPDPAEVVADEDVRLMAVHVRRAGGSYRIDTVWRPLNADGPTVLATARPRRSDRLPAHR